MLGRCQNSPPLWRGVPRDGVGAVVEGRSRFSNMVVKWGVNVAIHPSCMTILLVNKQHGLAQLHGIIGGGALSVLAMTHNAAATAGVGVMDELPDIVD